MSDSDDSDYKVEEYIKPEVVRNTYKNTDTISDHENGLSDESPSGAEDSDDNVSDSQVKNPQCKLKSKAEQDELEAERANSRFILYVTNLSKETTKTMLEDFFGDAGAIRSIRIPKIRLGCFAFVEMKDFEGYKNGLNFNNRELGGRKIQVYKGSKNKKHTSVKNKNLKRKVQHQHLSTIKMKKKERDDE